MGLFPSALARLHPEPPGGKPRRTLAALCPVYFYFPKRFCQAYRHTSLQSHCCGSSSEVLLLSRMSDDGSARSVVPPQEDSAGADHGETASPYVHCAAASHKAGAAAPDSLVSLTSCDTLLSSRGRPPSQELDEEYFQRCVVDGMSESNLQSTFRCELQRVKTLKKKYDLTKKRQRPSLPNAEELTKM